MMEDHFIELINVTKIYHQGDNPVVALDHINLNISKGEFVSHHRQKWLRKVYPDQHHWRFGFSGSGPGDDQR